MTDDENILDLHKLKSHISMEDITPTFGILLFRFITVGGICEEQQQGEFF